MTKEKPLILCVDDDPAVLMSLQVVLESDGYAVRTARSGKEGLMEIGRSKPDLVILDLMMEDVDSGNLLLKEIKATSPDMPVFMLSSIGDDLHRSVDTAELGFQGVFQKPINPKILLGLLRAKLGRPAVDESGKG